MAGIRFCVVFGVLLLAGVGYGIEVGDEVVEHHTLRPPYISEWWQGGLKYWDFGAGAVVTDKFVRLTPDKQSRVGWLWNNAKNHLESWEVTLKFRIHSYTDPGADGFAFWYTEDPYHMDPANEFHRTNPSLMGNKANFKGLGILFDTYDNDGQRDNPALVVLKNGGERTQWDSDHDFINQAQMRCVYDFRRSTEPITVRIVYHEKMLQVFIKSPSSTREHDCGAARDIDLPTGYYFGVTAATGHLADKHDVHAIIVSAPAAAAQREDQRLFDQNQQQ